LEAGPLLAGCPGESMFNVEHEPECGATSRTHLPHDGGPQRRDAIAFGRARLQRRHNQWDGHHSLVTLSFEKFRAGGKVIKVSGRSPHTLLAIAEAGHGIAIIPSIVQTRRYKLRFIAITYQRKPLREPICVVWDKRRVLPRYAQSFCELLLHI